MDDLRRIALSRRVFLAGSAGVGAATLAAACGAPLPTTETAPAAGTAAPAKEEAPAKAAEQVTVQLFASNVDDEGAKQFDSVIGQPFNEEHPNIKLQLILQSSGGTASVNEKLAAMIAGGLPPDIFDSPIWAEAWAKAEIIRPVDEFAARDKLDLNGYNHDLLDRVAKVEGKLWMVPAFHGGNAIGFKLNPQLFDEAGLNLPSADPNDTWTWDEWVGALQTLTKRAGTQVSQFGLHYYGWDAGSWPRLWETDWVTDDLQTVISDNPTMIEYGTKFFELPHKFQVVPKPGEAQELFGPNVDLFTTGKAAVTAFWPWGFKKYANKEEIDFVLAPFPRVNISTPDINWHMFGIIESSKNPDATWTAMQWLLRDARWAGFTWTMPAQRDLAETWVRDILKEYPQVRPEMVPLAMDSAVPQSNMARLTNFAQFYGPIAKTYSEELWTGTKDAATAFQELRPVLQAILEEGGN